MLGNGYGKNFGSRIWEMPTGEFFILGHIYKTRVKDARSAVFKESLRGLGLGFGKRLCM